MGISDYVAVAISEYNRLVAAEIENAELRRRIIALQKQAPVIVRGYDTSPRHWDMHMSEGDT